MVTVGDIYLCDFGEPEGHEAGFRRPAIVISPEALNRHGIAIVLPITRTLRGYPTHVELDGVLPVVGYVQCELIKSIAVSRFQRLVGTAGDVHLAQVRLILTRLLGLVPASTGR